MKRYENNRSGGGMNIDAQTALYGIIGYPLGHTFSPAMHNAAFEAVGFNGVYIAFPMKNILNLKYSMRQLNVRGLSVTIPHKMKIRRSVDQVDPLAVQIGSINTVVVQKNGLLKAYNTDGPGAVEAIERTGFHIQGKKILIIGSGGSARGIAFSLLDKKPSTIGIYARNIHTTRALCRSIKLLRSYPELRIYFPSAKKKQIRISHKKNEAALLDPQQLSEYDLIIQTTPMGMSGHPSAQETPLPKEFLFSHQTLFDIVYNPEKTPIVQLARKKKIEVIPGYKMLLYQGTRQFEFFTGMTPPVEIMEKALLAQLKTTR